MKIATGQIWQASDNQIFVIESIEKGIVQCSSVYDPSIKFGYGHGYFDAKNELCKTFRYIETL